VIRRRTISRKPRKAKLTSKAKWGAASRPAHNQRLSASSKETDIARVARERDEALEQLAAVSEILNIISGSPR
jgi:hypothetical protein